jgi:hypothetical protein
MRERSSMSLMLALACCSAAICATATAQPPQPRARITAEVAVGTEYDSNVSVDELDASSNEGDFAATVDAEIAVDTTLYEHFDLGLSYDFSQNIYHDFTEVNRQTHIVGANLQRAFAPLDTGLTVFYIKALLDGDDFLQLLRASPSVSGFFGKQWFGRGAYVYVDKTLDQNSERDASTHSGEADLYFFRRGLRSYFNFGYRYRDENATAARYDYRSHNLKLRYIHRFELPSRTVKMELAWRFEDRDYRSETPGIGEKRNDRRQRWQLDVELPLGQRAAVQAYTSYGDYRSNYPPTDYSQLVAGTRFIYRW